MAEAPSSTPQPNPAAGSAASAPAVPGTHSSPNTPRLESGAYEILRQRLAAATDALGSALDALNATRREVFGGIETSLLGTIHLGTDFNCTPQDLAALGGDRFLFGVNAQFGLKDEIKPPDVFQAFALDRAQSPPALTPLPLTEAFSSTEFERDFAELYRFYRETRFAKFHTQGLHLYQVFQTGKVATDIKAFRFRRPGDGRLAYDGARFDHEIQFPRQHGFAWKRVDASMSRRGEHPHYSIEDQLFVETVGGDLTLKVEDNTRSGSGIYSEPVDDPDQALEDAEISYAQVGPLLLLKIRPYRESRDRFLLFHRGTRAVHRIDAIGDSCVILPQDHGIIFATGIALMNGEVRLFDHGLASQGGLRFERQLQASNGEDSLFVFYSPEGGDYVLFHYNVVEQTLATPQHCHGFTLFGDGTLLLFRAEPQPGKLHALQLWQTPFLDETAQAARLARNDHPLAKIGNQALVRGLAELREILSLARRDESYEGLYLELARRARALLTGTWWIDDDTTALQAPLTQLASAAEGAIAEFAKVQELRRSAAARLASVQGKVDKTLREAELSRPDDILGFVDLLKGLRALRGEVITLREVRYADLPAMEALETRLVTGLDRLSQATSAFLAGEQALDPYLAQLDQRERALAQVDGSKAARELATQLDETAGSLELLTEITASLPVDDPQRATALIERVAALYARLNQLRARLQLRRRELTQAESQAEFTAQITLLTQAAGNALERADRLEQVDPQLTRLLAQLEELEGRFAESDEHLTQLSAKRDEIYDAFETRKASLLEARNRRANQLFQSAERILDGSRRRIAGFQQTAEIHAWFAGDSLLAKLRQLIADLDALGEAVKAQQLDGRLKTLRDEAIRSLRDRQDLYSDGGATIALGQHRFRVHEGEIELTLVPRQNPDAAADLPAAQRTQLTLHITGSSFYQPLDDPELDSFRDLWDLPAVAETPELARPEFLAWLFLENHPPPETPGQGLGPAARSPRSNDPDALASLDPLAPPDPRQGDAPARSLGEPSPSAPPGRAEARPSSQSTPATHPQAAGRRPHSWSAETLLPLLHALIQAHPEHQFARGVHDLDAARLLEVLGPLRERLGLAAAPPLARALAQLFLTHAATTPQPPAVLAQLRFARAAAEAFGSTASACSDDSRRLRTQLVATLGQFLADHPLDLPLPDPDSLAEPAAQWLLAVELHGQPAPLSAPSAECLETLRRSLEISDRAERLGSQLAQLGPDPAARIQLLLAWLQRALPPETFAPTAAPSHTPPLHFALEAAASYLAAFPPAGRKPQPHPSPALRFRIEGLLTDHPAFPAATLAGDYPSWAARLRHFVRVTQPRLAAFAAAKQRILARERARLRLHELRPQAMGGFVRNRLIDEVYLPLIGGNFARQLGAVGENARAERSGLMLLVSPPGYGKTTLIEYLAERLGLAFVKVNGPALGHAVTSLDPAQAPDAGSARELERLNLGLMMGDNVLLYLDDIQHTNPEFLQKFISLTDAQRKIEGVWNGRPVTHDLRGRRVAVVMAGNPYTESGGKFRIPDMLANRADTWNLGDIASGQREAFVDSYVENALAANPILAPLTTRPRADLHAFLRLAKGAPRDEVEFEAPTTPAEEADILAVLRHLLAVREVILQVNQAYIDSAAQEDRFRTEPPFLLQGSYRNMARIAGKILPLQTEAEITTLLQDHYRAESQSLAAGAEASLLKLKTLLGWAGDEERQRWNQVLTDYRRGKLLGGGDDDPVTKVVARLNALHEGIGSIAAELSQARAATTANSGKPLTLSDPSLAQLETIIARLRTVPVEVNLHLLHEGERIATIDQGTTHRVGDETASEGADPSSEKE